MLKNYAIAVIGLIISPSVMAATPLDTAIGSQGYYIFPEGGDSTAQLSLAIDQSGRWITGGSFYKSGRPTTFLTRHVPTGGQLDGRFGKAGQVIAPFGDLSYAAVGVSIDGANRIVFAGMASLPISCGGSEPTAYFFASRLLSDGPDSGGDPDPDFSGFLPGAAFLRPTGCSKQIIGPNGMAVDRPVSSDLEGDIVAVGAVYDGETRALIARWRPDGKPATDFGGGLVETSLPGFEVSARAAAFDSNRHLLVLTDASVGRSDHPALFRYLSDGSLDPTFADGTSDLASLDAVPCCIAIDSRGRILAAAIERTADGYDGHIVLIRLLASGAIDSSFGTHGYSRPAVGLQYSSPYGIALDASDRPLIAGFVVDFLRAEAALVHFNLDGTLNAAVGEGGVFRESFGYDGGTAQSVRIDAQGRPVVLANGTDRGGYFPVLYRYDELFGEGFD